MIRIWDYRCTYVTIRAPVQEYKVYGSHIISCITSIFVHGYVKWSSRIQMVNGNSQRITRICWRIQRIYKRTPMDHTSPMGSSSRGSPNCTLSSSSFSSSRGSPNSMGASLTCQYTQYYIYMHGYHISVHRLYVSVHWLNISVHSWHVSVHWEEWSIHIRAHLKTSVHWNSNLLFFGGLKMLLFPDPCTEKPEWCIKTRQNRTCCRRFDPLVFLTLFVTETKLRCQRFTISGGVNCVFMN